MPDIELFSISNVKRFDITFMATILKYFAHRRCWIDIHANFFDDLKPHTQYSNTRYRAASFSDGSVAFATPAHAYSPPLLNCLSIPVAALLRAAITLKFIIDII